jgi:hypothetical protein
MSSSFRVVKATVMAIVISFLCVLPPVIHFVSGPLGPGIGGYLAGNRMRLTGGQAAVLGLVLGFLAGVLTPIGLDEFGFLHGLATFVMVFLGAFVAIYVAALSGLAAWAGGSLARNENEEVASH